MMTDASTERAPISILDHAIRYVEVDRFALCLVQAGSKRPVLTAWNDPRRVLTTREAVIHALSSSVPYNIGLVHEQARTAALDVDHLEAVRALFGEFGWDYDALFAAYPRIHTREGKDKIIVRLPQGFDPGDSVQSKRVLTWPSPTGECDEKGRPVLMTVFELRGGKNQDVLPPSIHPDTQQPYQWAEGQAPWDFANGIPELPADHPLLIIWAQWETFKPQLEAACPWLPAAARITPPTARVYAPGPNNDVIGQFNRSTSVIEILERNGYQKRGKRWLAPHSSTKIPGVCLLEGGKIYSHHGSDVLGNGHAHDAFSVFTILEYNDSIDLAVTAAARELGIEFGEPPIASVDFKALIRNAQAKASPAKTVPVIKPVVVEAVTATYRFPRHLLDVPGLVGEVAHYINVSALYPQPVLALAASLAFCGALFGRKVATESDLRTNLYVMGVADSASGKEHARKAIKKLAVTAGVVELVGAEKIASDQGLFALLSEQHSCVCLLDEFGRTLRILNNDRAPAHLQQLVTTLLELTGSADSYIIEKRRAEHTADNPPRVISNPNLCLYATTVPGRLYQGLTPDEIIDGFLPRWLVFEIDTPDPEMSHAIQKIPDAGLVEKINDWKQRPFKAGLSNSLEPDVIRMDDGAQQVFAQALQTWRGRKMAARGTGLDALWGRAYEHALRLALIRGAGDGEVIDEAGAQWACELTDFLLTRTAEQALANVATNDYESGLQKVQSFIKDKGETTLRDLSRQFRWLKQKERDGIIGTLTDAQLIEISVVKGNNRPSVVIRWIDESVVPVLSPLSQMSGTTEPLVES